MSGDPDDPTTQETCRCWCGASGTFDELFDASVFEQCCGGSGVLHCECGGDFCVCHNHGEVECPGCEECRDNNELGPRNDEYDDYDDYDDYDVTTEE